MKVRAPNATWRSDPVKDRSRSIPIISPKASESMKGFAVSNIVSLRVGLCVLMRLVAHGSPLVLEHELLDRVAAAKSTDPLAAVLIVVPSRRLADHVTYRLVERFGALLNVSVVHHRALGERVAESVGIRWRPLLDEPLTEMLFARVIQQAPAGPLRDFVRVRPGASFALRRTLSHLREAGLSKGDAAAVPPGPIPRSRGSMFDGLRAGRACARGARG